MVDCLQMNQRYWYLELSEVTGSHKFYELTLEHNALKVSYGRIGELGQQQQKEFASEAEALLEADKRLKEKKRKGYQAAIKGERDKRAVERLSIRTPKAPVNLAQLVPALKPLGRVAVRLHPRRGEAPPEHSKIGGTFLWPREEAWPTCEEHGCNLVTVLQLRAEDIPELMFPTNHNLFQLLWCPNDHEKLTPLYAPHSKVVWRNTADVQNPLSKMPEPNLNEFDYIPQLCTLHPERVLEYPDVFELSDQYPELMETIENIEHPYFEGLLEDDEIFEDTSVVYQYLLSVAPGIKVGGYPDWIQYPEYPQCVCGRQTEYLLTISSREFDSGTHPRWAASDAKDIWQKPYEERTAIQSAPDLMLGDAGNINFFICRCCPDWPIYSVFQCS